MVLYNEEIKPLMYEGFISKEKHNNLVMEILKLSLAKFYADKEYNGLLGNSIAVFKDSGIYFGHFRIDESFQIVKDGRGIMVEFDGTVNEGIWRKGILSYINDSKKVKQEKVNTDIKEAIFNLSS